MRVDYDTREGPSSIFAADLDNDGDDDLTVTCTDSNYVSVLLNNGDGTFAPAINFAVGQSPRSVFAADFDGDTDYDLAVTEYYSETVTILFNTTVIVTGIDDDVVEQHLPNSFRLAQNYPNPFNPATNIAYSLDVRSHVAIDIYNVLGRKVRTLIDDTQPAGNYQVIWDGTDQAGHSVATGLYLYRLQIGDRAATKKMILLK